MRKPKKEQFNAPHETSDELSHKLKKFEKVSSNDFIVIFLYSLPIISLLGLSYLISVYYLGSVAYFLIGFFIAMWPSAFIGSVCFKIARNFENKIELDLSEADKKTYFNLKTMYENAIAYENAISKWEYLNSITSKEFWLKLKGEMLENKVAEVLRNKNWEVIKTPRTGDEGIDLKVYDGKKNILIQCKGHRKNVGVSTVRDAVGVKANNPHHDVWVIAPVGFTKGSISLAKRRDIDLFDAQKLISFINQ